MGILLVEAVQRIVLPPSVSGTVVDGRTMMGVAAAGVAVNILCLVVLGAHGGHVHETAAAAGDRRGMIHQGPGSAIGASSADGAGDVEKGSTEATTELKGTSIEAN